MPACLGDSTAETTIRPLRLKVIRQTNNVAGALRLVRARISALANAGQDARAIQTWCATPNSHRPVQKLGALIGNPRASQQLMGQLPICCCRKAKKFNDFSRACACVGKGRKRETPGSKELRVDTFPARCDSAFGACLAHRAAASQSSHRYPQAARPSRRGFRAHQERPAWPSASYAMMRSGRDIGPIPCWWARQPWSVSCAADVIRFRRTNAS